jgi:hypothetical protein
VSTERGHLPTYVALPLLTAGFFFAAAFKPWWILLSSGSLLTAVAFVMTWAVLLPVLLWKGRIHSAAPLAGIVTFFAVPVVGGWLAPHLGWSIAATQVTLVEGVMLILAVASLTIGWRRRLAEASGPIS